MTFDICFLIHTPRLRRTPLKRGLAVAVRLSLLEYTTQDYNCHSDSVKEIYDHTSVTAAASPFERGATGVAGYV